MKEIKPYLSAYPLRCPLCEELAEIIVQNESETMAILCLNADCDCGSPDNSPIDNFCNS
jgi:hypothetical protein